MAAATDKARFYLEQSVPELREWEKKDIFSRDEIAAIAAKRSDFEHTLNARGSKAADYARYAEYEMNLDSLRRKRVKRKGVKSPTHTGQRRVLFILDRATRRFHGDMGLWMQYIDYARKQGANKKLTRILTDALRLHPTKPQLWIYAARYAMDVQADSGAARSYMQRGLRFCKTSRELYLEYARLELAYIAKLSARRKVLGLDPTLSPDSVADTGGLDSDMIRLPDISAKGDPPSAVEDYISKSTAESPVMSGAIPMAIYDTAMREFSHDAVLGVQFFDTAAEFSQLACISAVLQHIIDVMSTHTKALPYALACRCKKLLVGISPASPKFPSALRSVLAQINSSMASVAGDDRTFLAGQLGKWLEGLADYQNLDDDLRRVLAAAKRRLKGQG